MALTDEQFYSNSSNWGKNQYVPMKDIINNFRLFYVGDDKVINDAKKYDIVFHAKRGLQEIHYDALKEIKAWEIEMPDTLEIILPRDFVNLVSVSWVDSDGRLRHMTSNTQTTSIDIAPMQGDQGEYLYDSNEEMLSGTPLMDIRNYQNVDDQKTLTDATSENSVGGRFGMDTANANVNGTYDLNKKLGVIRFSSDVSGGVMVIQYISDGLTDIDEGELKVHKLAEDFLYKYIAHELIRNKFGVQEYIVRRLKKDAFAALKNTKIRMMDIHPLDIIQSMRGRNKWIK